MACVFAAAPAAAGQRLETLRFFDPSPQPSPVVGFRLHVGPDAAHTTSINIGKPAAVAGGIRSYPLFLADDAEVYVALTAYDAAGRESPRSNAIFRARRGPAFDHDGDGASDLLRIDAATGAVDLLRRGSAASPLRLAYPEPLKSSIVARGDFDGNGTSDILWQRKKSRASTLWLVAGDGSVDAVQLPTPHPRLRVVGSADLDGSSRSDLVLQNAFTDELHLWLTTADAATPDEVVIPGLPSPWRLVGVGDVDADRRGDFVWWDPSTGAIRVWQMNGASVLEDRVLLGVASTRASPIGLGDYDGDGAEDLLMRLPMRRWIAFAPLRGQVQTPSLVADVPDARVGVAGGHDFDGEGSADLLLVDPSRRTLDVLLLGPYAGDLPPADFSAASMSGDLARAVGDSDNDWQPDSCDADFDNDGVVANSDYSIYKACRGEPAVGACAAVDQDGDGIVGNAELASVLSRLGEAPCADSSAP